MTDILAVTKMYFGIELILLYLVRGSLLSLSHHAQNNLLEEHVHFKRGLSVFTCLSLEKKLLLQLYYLQIHFWNDLHVSEVAKCPGLKGKSSTHF